MSFMLLGILNSQAAGGGGAGAYDLLETVEVTGSPTSVTLSGLSAYSADYKHLEIRGILQADRDEVLEIQFNGDTGANYRYGYMGSSDSSTTSYYQTGPVNKMELGEAFADRDTNNNNVAVLKLMILRAFSNYDKNFMAYVGQANEDRRQSRLTNGKWENNAALSSINLEISAGTMTSKTRFSIYGLKG